MAGAIITWNMTGDVEIQRRLQTYGSRVRLELGKALSGIALDTKNAAMAGAPTARIRDGIGVYGHGFGSKGAPAGRGIPKAMTAAVQEIERINAQGGLACIVTNEYYLGRFYDEGFSDEVDVRAHTRRAAGKKSWALSRANAKFKTSFRMQYGGEWKAKMVKAAKGYGYTDRKIRLLVKGGQVSVDFYNRRHRVKRIPFFLAAATEFEGDLTRRLDAAYAKAVVDGS